VYWGLDDVVIQTFAPPFVELEADQFLNEFLLKNFKLAGLVVGFDFRFGKGRKGDSSILRTWAEIHRTPLKVVEPLVWRGDKISSSRIRELLSQGQVRQIPDLLGRAFSVEGTIVPGFQRGSKIGFPTANIKLEGLVLPADGVYFTRSLLAEKIFSSVTHIGAAPTVGRAERVIETHILGYDGGPLYDQKIEVQFLDYIRGVQKFDSVEELRLQIQKDIQAGLELQS
jgi:riboflavin kinase/FMN adenylyltransferase